MTGVGVSSIEAGTSFLPHIGTAFFVLLIVATMVFFVAFAFRSKIISHGSEPSRLETAVVIVFVVCQLSLVGMMVFTMMGLMHTDKLEAEAQSEQLVLLEEHYDVSFLNAESIDIPQEEDETAEVAFYTDNDNSQQYSGNLSNIGQGHIALVVPEGTEGFTQVEWSAE